MIAAALLQEKGNGRLDSEIASLRRAFEKRGIPTKLFLEKHLLRRRVAFAPETLVAGEIPVVLAALNQLGIEPPAPNDYPDCLTPFLKRRVWTSDVRRIKQRLYDVAAPCFIKPRGRLKRFTGRVFESWHDLAFLSGAGNDTEVYCSEIVEWTSEHRVYVAGGRILGIGHYSGNPEVLPDMNVVNDAVATLEASGQAPAGYGIDFGVLAGGETALVELNDGFSLGSYGLDDDAYAEVIMARWLQLNGRDLSG